MDELHAGAHLGPYVLGARLGGGGMGVVFRARHVDSGAPVAIKTVRVANPRQVHGIRREIHALSRIRHPGIVRILDHGVHEGVPWYAMAVLEGHPLRDWIERPEDAATSMDVPLPAPPLRDTVPVRSAPAPEPGEARQTDATWADPVPADRPRVDERRLVEVLGLVRALCDALAFLHGVGIVHRDLKPDNVLVVDGMPILVDFGLVGQVPRGRETLWLDGLVHGTVSYMAPEQLRGDGVDARADLYALGVILYELVTGRLPFRGRTAGATATMHLSRLPRPPSHLVAGLPPALEELVLGLLSKRPADRTGHADDVARRLEALGAPRPRWQAPTPRAYLYRPRLAGRSQVLEQLEGHLRGERPLALVAGESGVGKTRLVLELAHVATQRGWDVIGCACAPLDADAPGLGGLHALREVLVVVADRCREGGRAVTERLLGDRGPVLAPYAAALRDLPGMADRPAPPPLPVPAARLRALTALSETLAALSDDAPVLVVVDDLQWADDLTVQWLEQLRREGNDRLRVVGTYRLGEGSQRLRALCSADGVLHVTLRRLDKSALRRMVSDMLAVPAPSDALVAFLTERSEGNPFFVAEYLRAAVDEGLLRRDRNGRWGVEGAGPAAYERLPLPTSLQQLVRRRLAGLPLEIRPLLEVAAVLGREMDASLLESMLPDEEPTRLEGLRELLDRQILEEREDGRLRFVHHKLREGAYGAIEPDRRRTLHARVARALEGQPHPDHAALAHHWQRAGEPLRARVHHLAGARQATARHDLPEARQLYRSGLVLYEATDPVGIEARIGLVAEVLRPLGLAAEALEQLHLALDGARHVGDLRLQAAAIEEQGRVTRQIGRMQDAAAYLRHALAMQRALGDLQAQGRLLCALAGTLPPPGAARCYTSAVELARRTDDRWLSARALLGRGRVLHDRAEPGPSEQALREALGIFHELRDLRSEADVLVALGDLLVDTRTAEALASYEQALATYRDIGDRLRCAVVQASMATLLHAVGRAAESHALYAEALQEFRELGHHRFQGRALHRIGTHLRREGRLPEARALNEQALVLLEVVGDRVWSARTRRELAEIALREHRLTEAIRHATRAVELARAAGDPALEAEALASHARAVARTGDRDGARQLAHAALALARTTGDARAEATTWAHLARVLERPVDPASLEQAGHVLREAGRHEEAARALVELGHLALSQGDSARSWLAAAREAHNASVYLDPEVGDALRDLHDAEAER